MIEDDNPSEKLFIQCKIEMLKFATEDILVLSQICDIDDKERLFI